MSVSVVVPWRGGCLWREAAWAHLQRRWAHEHPGWEVVQGHAPDGPWCKADAVADGLARTIGDVLVVADADVWTEHVTDAVAAVEQGAPWTIPHLMVHRLTPDTTRDTILGVQPLTTGLPVEREPYPGYPGGGITILPRALYEQVPLDPRYRGWGQEDESWALALHTLAGEPWRGTEPLYHLWHPPQPRSRTSRHWGSEESKALFHRYQRAAHNPHTMRALLNETSPHRVSNEVSMPTKLDTAFCGTTVPSALTCNRHSAGGFPPEEIAGDT